MNLPLDCSVFFPSSTITTGFGWDPLTFPGHPRIHTAVDRAGKGIVHSPVSASRTAWIDNDAEGCSVFRLFFDGGEFRMLHFLRAELDSGALAAAIAHAPLAKGAPIGPTGNHGLSVPMNGGTGRHVHYSLILEPGAYDNDLQVLSGGSWNSDRTSDYRAKYGAPFISQAAQRGIQWMNEFCIARNDPYYDGKLRFYINTYRFFGM
jgi:hypothetical protein